MFTFKFIWGWMRSYKTQEKRLKLYRRMLTLLEHSTIPFCHTLAMAGGFEIGWAINNIYRFPELYYFKPKNRTPVDMWYPLDEYGMRKRVSILKHIIEKYSGEDI